MKLAYVQMNYHVLPIQKCALFHVCSWHSWLCRGYLTKCVSQGSARWYKLIHYISLPYPSFYELVFGGLWGYYLAVPGSATLLLLLSWCLPWSYSSSWWWWCSSLVHVSWYSPAKRPRPPSESHPKTWKFWWSSRSSRPWICDALCIPYDFHGLVLKAWGCTVTILELYWNNSMLYFGNVRRPWKTNLKFQWMDLR